jgi:hypothetical protein
MHNKNSRELLQFLTVLVSSNWPAIKKEHQARGSQKEILFIRASLYALEAARQETYLRRFFTADSKAGNDAALVWPVDYQQDWLSTTDNNVPAYVTKAFQPHLASYKDTKTELGCIISVYEKPLVHEQLTFFGPWISETPELHGQMQAWLKITAVIAEFAADKSGINPVCCEALTSGILNYALATSIFVLGGASLFVGSGGPQKDLAALQSQMVSTIAESMSKNPKLAGGWCLCCACNQKISVAKTNKLHGCKKCPTLIFCSKSCKQTHNRTAKH